MSVVLPAGAARRECGGWQGFGQVQLEASVVQAFLESLGDGVDGLVSAGGGAVVEAEGRHVHRSTRPTFCLSVRTLQRGPEGKEQRHWRVSLLDRVLGIVSGPNKTKLSFVWHSSLDLAKVPLCGTSLRKQELSTFSRSVVESHGLRRKSATTGTCGWSGRRPRSRWHGM